MNKLFLIPFLLIINLYSFDFFSLVKGKSESSDDGMMPFGIISIPIPNMEELGEEGNNFFDEFTSDTYSIYNNGIIQISNKYRVPVKIKDIAYTYSGHDVFLIPNSENIEQIEAIDEFYSKLKQKGKRLLKEYAIKNKVVAIAFGHISPIQIKKSIKSGVLSFAIKIYILQSEATMYKLVKIKVENLATDPYYDPEELVSNIEQKVLQAYEKVIATVQQSGSVLKNLDDMAKAQKEKNTAKSIKKEEEKVSASEIKEERKANVEQKAKAAMKELEEEDGGSDEDW